MKMNSLITFISFSFLSLALSASDQKDYKKTDAPSHTAHDASATAAAGAASCGQCSTHKIDLKKLEPLLDEVWAMCEANVQTTKRPEIVKEDAIVAYLKKIKAELTQAEYRTILRSRDEFGRTLLFVAFDSRRYKVLGFLKPDSDLDHTTAAQQTILFHAIKCGTLDQLKTVWPILRDSIDIRKIVYVDHRGFTALTHAIFSHDPEKVDFIINECGACPVIDGDSYLACVEMARETIHPDFIKLGENIAALKKNNLKIRRKFEEMDADHAKKRRAEISKLFDSAMQTKDVSATFQALADSMKIRHPQLMQFWQRCKARFSAAEFAQLATTVNEEDHTLLMKAAYHGFVEIASDVCPHSNVDHASKITANKRQENALSLAMEGSSKKNEPETLAILALLFKHNVSVKSELIAIMNDGREARRTPLMIAVHCQKPCLVKAILNYPDQEFPVSNEEEQSCIMQLVHVPGSESIKKILDNHIASKKAKIAHAKQAELAKGEQEKTAQKEQYVKELMSQFQKLGQTAPDFAQMSLSSMLNKIKSNKQKLIKRAHDEALKKAQEEALKKEQEDNRLALAHAAQLKALQTASASASGSAHSASALASQSLETDLEADSLNRSAKPEDDHALRLALYLKKKSKQGKNKAKKAQKSASTAPTAAQPPSAIPAQGQEKIKAKSKAAELEALAQQYSLPKKGKAQVKLPAQQLPQSNEPKKKVKQGLETESYKK